jgi:hypothetical protein
MRHYSAESLFVVAYLRENESIFKTASACETGDPGVLIAKKTEGRKSSDTAPLSLKFKHSWANYTLRNVQ